MVEDFRLLAAVIAAHPDRQVAGRTRLQKTVKLLQSMGLQTRFTYSIHFYGPYSEDLQACLGLLEKMGLAEEGGRVTAEGEKFYYIEKATPAADTALVHSYQQQISLMANTPTDILELAATYQAFCEQGENSKTALDRLKRKKASKCIGDNVQKAMQLLKQLKLQPAA